MFKLQMQIINIVMLIIYAFAGTVWPYLYLYCPLIVFHILPQSILLLLLRMTLDLFCAAPRLYLMGFMLWLEIDTNQNQNIK